MIVDFLQCKIIDFGLAISDCKVGDAAATLSEPGLGEIFRIEETLSGYTKTAIGITIDYDDASIINEDASIQVSI